MVRGKGNDKQGVQMYTKLEFNDNQINILLTALWSFNETENSAKRAADSAKLARHIEALRYNMLEEAM
jgi:hypothetical protein